MSGQAASLALSTRHEQREADSSRHEEHGDPEQGEEAGTLTAVLNSRFRKLAHAATITAGSSLSIVFPHTKLETARLAARVFKCR